MQPEDYTSQFNATTFLVQQMLARISNAALVKVVKCTNSGGVAPVGFVDIQPMVHQIDGNWNAVPHGVIYQCPYLRLQGGANAVILDPQPGDIGIAVFADRDISSAVASRKPSPPGSRRMFDMADALYLGGVLNGTPSQFVEFAAGGVTITSPTAVTVNAPAVTVNATSAVVKAASIALQNAGAALQTLLNSTLLPWLNSHVHGNGNGGANTTAPTTSPSASVQTSVVKAE